RGKPIHIIGVYGSSRGAAKYWEDLRDWLHTTLGKKERAIVIGDLNQAPNPLEDRVALPGTISPPKVPPAAFTEMLNDRYLHDVWRELHPSKRQYSFHAIKRDPRTDAKQS